MLDVDVAAARLGELIAPVRGSERVRVEAALGRVPTEDIVAPMSLPPFDASAMDGYAVLSQGLGGDARKRLQVIDQSLAGHPASAAVGVGEAIRIFTGAPMPVGADSVVLQEDVKASEGAIEFDESVRKGQHVRPAGNDIAEGDTICPGWPPPHGIRLGVAGGWRHRHGAGKEISPGRSAFHRR